MTPRSRPSRPSAPRRADPKLLRLLRALRTFQTQALDLVRSLEPPPGEEEIRVLMIKKLLQHALDVTAQALDQARGKTSSA